MAAGKYDITIEQGATYELKIINSIIEIKVCCVSSRYAYYYVIA